MKALLCLALLALSTSTLVAQPALIGRDTPPLEPRIVAVSAEETVRIPATRARLGAAIEVQADTPAAAQEVVRQRSQALLTYLQRARVENLQAGAMALHPVYGESRPDPRETGDRPAGPEIVGYRAQWNASFEVDAARAGELADGVVQAGAARLAQFEFTASEAELAAAQQRAAGAAARRAREDARAVLEALGYRGLDVVRIELNGAGPVAPLRKMEMASFAANAGDAATAVEPGLIEVRAHVRLEAAY